MSSRGSFARYMFVVFHHSGIPRNITACMSASQQQSYTQNAKMTFRRVMACAGVSGGGAIANERNFALSRTLLRALGTQYRVPGLGLPRSAARWDPRQARRMRTRIRIRNDENDCTIQPCLLYSSEISKRSLLMTIWYQVRVYISQDSLVGN